MLHPTPAQPGEYFVGHLERIHLVNGLWSRTDTYHCLTLVADANTDRAWRTHPAVRLSLLAAFQGVDIDAYCKEHTYLQYRLLFLTGEQICLENNGNSRVLPTLKWQTGHDGKVYLCPMCLLSDKRRAGAPYLRAVHHLPGVYWCVIHFAALIESHLSAKPVEPQIPLLDIATVTPVMKRFAEISASMLKERQTIALRVFRHFVREPASNLGIRMSKKRLDGGQFMSAVIAEHADQGWLQKLFPGYSNLRNGKPFTAIDGPLLGDRGAPAAFALTLAYLFPTAKEAIKCIDEMTRHSEDPFNVLENEEVYRSFVRNRGNLSALTHELGWSRSTFSFIGTRVLPSMHPNSRIGLAIRDVMYRDLSEEEAATNRKVKVRNLSYLLQRGGDLLRAAIKEMDCLPQIRRART